MATGFIGGCMCGAVRYECSAEQASFAAICYCTDCQRESGSAFTANMVVPTASFKLTRGELSITSASQRAATRFAAVSAPTAEYRSSTIRKCSTIWRRFA